MILPLRKKEIQEKYRENNTGLKKVPRRLGRVRGEVQEVYVGRGFGVLTLEDGDEPVMFFEADLKNVKGLSKVHAGSKIMCRIDQNDGSLKAKNVWVLNDPSKTASSFKHKPRLRSRSPVRRRYSPPPRRYKRRERPKRYAKPLPRRAPPRRIPPSRRSSDYPPRDHRSQHEPADKWFTNNTYTGDKERDHHQIQEDYASNIQKYSRKRRYSDTQEWRDEPRHDFSQQLVHDFSTPPRKYSSPPKDSSFWTRAASSRPREPSRWRRRGPELEPRSPDRSRSPPPRRREYRPVKKETIPSYDHQSKEEGSQGSSSIFHYLDRRR